MILPGFPMPAPMIGGGPLQIDASGSVTITVGSDGSGGLGARTGSYGSLLGNTLLSVNGVYQSIDRIVTYSAGTASARNQIIISLDDPSWNNEIMSHLQSNYNTFGINSAGGYEIFLSWGSAAGDIDITDFGSTPHTGFETSDISSTRFEV